MSRAYLVYIFMFAILAGGMWVVLTLGRAQRAPDDLAGEWAIVWSPPHDQSNPVPLRIDQSGRFFVVRIARDQPLKMILQPGWKGFQEGPNLQMELAGEGWKLKFSGKSATARASAINIELISPSAQRVGSATRAGVTDTQPTSRPSGMAHAR